MKEYNQPVTLVIQNKLNSVQALNLAKEIILSEFEFNGASFSIDSEENLVKTTVTESGESVTEVIRKVTDEDKAVFIVVGAIQSKISELEAE